MVTNAVELLCKAVEKNSPEKAVKFVLMSSVAFRYKDLGERVSIGQKITMSIIRLLALPHCDNERAADYLRFTIGQKNAKIQWAAVRPDSLINEIMLPNINCLPRRLKVYLILGKQVE